VARPPRTTRAGARIWILAALTCATLPACRYQNVNAAGRFGPAPYIDLECFEPGNALGFAFEVPACDCQAGIRLKRVVNPTDRGTHSVRYVQEVGWAEGSSSALIVMSGQFPNRLDELAIGGRRLPAYEHSDAADRESWDRHRDAFAMTWQNYAPVLEDMRRVCNEDRAYRKASRLAQRTASADHPSRKRIISRTTTLIYR
jgi:hypothetical protein